MKTTLHDEKGTTWIKEVEVVNLHGDLNFTVRLNKYTSIIYGKNGRGKTTLLHILANLSEGDIERFIHIKFDEIIVRNSAGSFVRLKQDHDAVVVEVDDVEFGPISSGGEISLEMAQALHTVMGERATYLPAFRSILERVSTSRIGYPGEVSDSDVDAIYENERRIYRSPHNDLRGGARAENIRVTAMNTVMCRKWFGNFVPVIRYPSVMEVLSSVRRSFEIAQLRISDWENENFPNLFEDVVSAYSSMSDHETISIFEMEAIRGEIYKLLDSGNGITYSLRPDLVRRHQRILDLLGENIVTNGLVLRVYRDFLKEQSEVREDSLRNLINFQDSLNKLLDKKSLNFTMTSFPGDKSALRGSLPAVEILSSSLVRLPARALSSGERHIFTMLYCATRPRFVSGPLLIDEPEISLHIDWQRIILAEIQKQNPLRQIIVCTHSPDVGGDHELNVINFDPFYSDRLSGDDVDSEIEDLL